MKHAFLLTPALLLTALLSGAALTGCKGTTQSGTKYTQFPNREFQVHLNGELAKVHDAAVEVLRDELGYTITKDAKDAFEGEVNATTAQNDKVVVQTFKESDKVTKVQVWVGPVGDQSKSQQIIDKIEAEL